MNESNFIKTYLDQITSTALPYLSNSIELDDIVMECSLNLLIAYRGNPSIKKNQITKIIKSSIQKYVEKFKTNNFEIISFNDLKEIPNTEDDFRNYQFDCELLKNRLLMAFSDYIKEGGIKYKERYQFNLNLFIEYFSSDITFRQLAKKYNIKNDALVRSRIKNTFLSLSRSKSMSTFNDYFLFDLKEYLKKLEPNCPVAKTISFFIEENIDISPNHYLFLHQYNCNKSYQLLQQNKKIQTKMLQ